MKKVGTRLGEKWRSRLGSEIWKSAGQEEKNLFLLDSLAVCSLFTALRPAPSFLVSVPPLALSLPSINDPTPFTEDYTRECHRQPCSVEAGITEETSSNSLT